MTFNQLIESVNIYKRASESLGRSLEIARDEYQDMVGEGVNTWSEFLSQPEIGLTVREANLLSKLSNFLIEVEVPIEELNLSTARFAASKGILDPELVEDMKVLSLKDFRDRHYEYTTDDRGQRTYTYMVMKRCVETGNLTKVHGVDSEEVESKFAEKLYE